MTEQQSGEAAGAGRQNLTTEEVAARFRTSPATVRYWRHVGKGPKSFRVGKRTLYAIEDVEAFSATARAGVETH